MAKKYVLVCPSCGTQNVTSATDCIGCGGFLDPDPANIKEVDDAGAVLSLGASVGGVNLCRIDPRLTGAFAATGERLPVEAGKVLNLGISHSKLSSTQSAIHLDLRAWAEPYVFEDPIRKERNWGVSTFQASLERRAHQLFLTPRSPRVKMILWKFNGTDFDTLPLDVDAEVELEHGDVVVVGYIPLDDLARRPQSPKEAQGVMFQVEFT